MNILEMEAEKTLLVKTLERLLDRDITYLNQSAIFHFETQDQAINHIHEARKIVKRFKSHD